MPVPDPDQLSAAQSSNHQNLTTPNDEAHQKLQEVLQHARTLTMVLSITMVVALVGNMFLAFLILKMSRRSMGPVQILILHTCVADICFALCTALPQMASTITFPHFYGGDFLCRLVKYLQLIPMFASPYLLVAISVDRYIAICKPLSALKWKYRLVHALAGTAWAASLLFATPNIFAFRYDVVADTRIMACMFQMDEGFEKAWIGIFSLIVWLAPSIIVAVLYTFVCMTVWRSMRRGDNRKGSSPSLHHREDRDGCLENGGLSSKRRASYSAEYDCATSTTTTTMRKTFAPTINAYKIKTVKLTLTIVVANFVLWAPFCITNVISTYFRDIQLDLMVTTCIMLVGNANSCVNPWIYVVFNYKRVWETLCGNEQSNSASRNRTGPAVPAKVSRTTSSPARNPAPIKRDTYVQYDCDDSGATPRINYIHSLHQNSPRNSDRRESNHGAIIAKKLSQTSTNTSFSAF